MHTLLWFLLATPVFGEESVTTEIFNQTSDRIQIFFTAQGCTGTERGETSVCKSAVIEPSSSVKYTFSQVTLPGVGADCTARDRFGQFGNGIFTGPALTYVDGAGGDCTYVQGAPTPTRADRKSTVAVSEGFWGNWRLDADCPAGSYAVGYQLRVEASQGKGDDTALNAVRLRCNDSARTVVASAPGYWGDWGPWGACPTGGVLTGARLKLEPKQGTTSDDTAANDVNFQCSTNGFANQVPSGSTSYVLPPAGGAWGTWGPVVSCPANQAVCGLRARVERPIVPDPLNPTAPNDDTAMNGLRLNCCSR